MNRYTMLKIESLVNKILYEENTIDKIKYDKMKNKLEKLLFEESKENDLI